MNPNGKSMIYIVVAGVIVIALITGGIFLFRNNKEEEKKPKEGTLEDTPTSSSKSSAFSSSSSYGGYSLPYSSNPSAQMKSVKQNKLFSMSSSVLAAISAKALPDELFWSDDMIMTSKNYLATFLFMSNLGDNISLELKDDATDLLGWFTYIENYERLNWVANKSGGFNSGYLVLFAAIYHFLKDPNHAVHKTFFNVSSYDVLSNLPKPKGFKSIEDLFKTLQKNLKNPDHIKTGAFSFAEKNKNNIIMAFRYLLLKCLWSDQDCQAKFLKTRKALGMPNIPEESLHNTQYFQDTFAAKYVGHDQEPELDGANAYRLSEDDLVIWSFIFNINFCVLIESLIKKEDSAKYLACAQTPAPGKPGYNSLLRAFNCYRKLAKEPLSLTLHDNDDGVDYASEATSPDKSLWFYMDQEADAFFAFIDDKTLYEN